MPDALDEPHTSPTPAPPRAGARRGALVLLAVAVVSVFLAWDGSLLLVAGRVMPLAGISLVAALGALLLYGRAREGFNSFPVLVGVRITELNDVTCFRGSRANRFHRSPKTALPPSKRYLIVERSPRTTPVVSTSVWSGIWRAPVPWVPGPANGPGALWSLSRPRDRPAARG